MHNRYFGSFCVAQGGSLENRLHPHKHHFHMGGDKLNMKTEGKGRKALRDCPTNPHLTSLSLLERGSSWTSYFLPLDLSFPNSNERYVTQQSAGLACMKP